MTASSMIYIERDIPHIGLLYYGDPWVDMPRLPVATSIENLVKVKGS